MFVKTHTRTCNHTRSRRLQPAWHYQRAEHCAQTGRRLKSAATPVTAGDNLIYCVLIPTQLARTLRVQVANLNPLRYCR